MKRSDLSRENHPVVLATEFVEDRFRWPVLIGCNKTRLLMSDCALVVVLAFNSRDELICLRNEPHHLRENGFRLPTGCAASGQSLKVATSRTLMQHLGVQARSINLLGKATLGAPANAVSAYITAAQRVESVAIPFLSHRSKSELTSVKLSDMRPDVVAQLFSTELYRFAIAMVRKNREVLPPSAKKQNSAALA